MPPNISIRRRLLVYLSSGLLATWLLTAVAAITVSLVEINEANDTQMTQLARSLPSLLPKQPVDLQEIDDSRWLDSGFADKNHESFAEGEGADWAVVFSEEGQAVRESFVNLTPTSAGGTHEAGLRDGLFTAV